MSTYLASLIGVCLTVSLALAVSYKEDGALRLAFGIILLYAAAVPLVGAIDSIDLSDISFEASSDIDTEDAMDQRCAEAFERGIVLFIAEEFGLNGEDICVRAHGFVATDMRAELIEVILCGEARLADFRAIRDKIEKNGFGECDVRVAV